MNKSFEYTKNFNLYAYNFICYAKYDVKSEKIVVEIAKISMYLMSFIIRLQR